MPGRTQAKAPPSSWAAAQRKQVKCHVSQRGFFHSNSSFLKFINDNNNIYTITKFNENNNIYNTNNNIFSSNNMNYYRNNIIDNTKYNNTLEMNTINYIKK